MKGKLGGKLQSNWCTSITLRKNFTYGNGAKDVMSGALNTFFFNYTLRALFKRWSNATSSWIPAQFKVSLSSVWTFKPLKVHLEGTWVDSSIVSNGSVELSGPLGVHNTSPFQITAVFDMDVTGLIIGNFTVANCVVNSISSVSASIYLITITASGSGNLSIVLPANSVIGPGAMHNKQSNTLPIVFDNAPLTVSISAPASINNVSFLVTMTFNKKTIGFLFSELILTNCTADSFVSSDTVVYTMKVSPSGSGDIRIIIPINSAFDITHNGNTEVSATVIYDIVKPTAGIAAPFRSPEGSTTPVAATIYFSKPVVGFALSDFALSGSCTLSNLVAVNQMVYTFTITPIYTDCVLQLNAGAVNDLSGNANNAMNGYSKSHPNSPPFFTCDISVPANSIIPFTATFTFSTNLRHDSFNSFGIEDLSLTNCIADSFTVIDWATYTMRIVPTGGNIRIFLLDSILQNEAFSSSNFYAMATVSYS